MRKYITKFCLKHPNFGFPNLMRYIAIANALFWVASFVSPKFLNYLSFNPHFIFNGQIWRIISFVFIPPTTGILGAIGIYFYYVVGNILENYWGTARFNLFILFGILLTLLYGFLMYFLLGLSVSLSAAYIFLSMFLAFAALYPDTQVLYMFLIPIKMKWLALLDLALFVVDIFRNPFPLNLLPLVAIVNVLVFCGKEVLNIFDFRS